MKDIDQYRGCLIGGAVGDALGYAVEFLEDGEIFRRYGPQGIIEYDLVDGIAPISDDTQMTLFTANGLLLADTRDTPGGTIESYPVWIARCYQDWLKTQTAEEFGFEPPNWSWLNHIPAMNHSRAPGHTCLNSLFHNNLGSVSTPRNNSKGCGGVMRVAPVGLYFDESRLRSDEIDLLGAQAAALTHGHELGYIPAAMLAHIVHCLSGEGGMSVLTAVENAKAAMMRLFPEAEHLPELLALTDQAVRLAADRQADELDAIRQLGQGWVAEETIAIAIYCAVRYEDDFEKAIIAAVNHSGDSDSTGAVTGNILGVHLGLKAIPEKFLARLELKDTILEMADDLFYGCQQDEAWRRKYMECDYPRAGA